MHCLVVSIAEVVAAVVTVVDNGATQSKVTVVEMGVGDWAVIESGVVEMDVIKV